MNQMSSPLCRRIGRELNRQGCEQMVTAMWYPLRWSDRQPKKLGLVDWRVPRTQDAAHLNNTSGWRRKDLAFPRCRRSPRFAYRRTIKSRMRGAWSTDEIFVAFS